MNPLLRIRDLHASYGTIRVLHGVDVDVYEGQMTLLLGANGAGKTTTLRAICGTVAGRGTLEFGGASLLGKSPFQVARLGIAHVPQGRGTFAELTVADNLAVGAIHRRDRVQVAADIDAWCNRFPVLGRRRAQYAGLLSGGEQQMLAIARAMLSQPRLLMLDEPSLGLAPKIVHEIFDFFNEVNRDLGAAMLIVEQNAELALQFAEKGYVLETGRIVLSGTASELHGNAAVQDAYLGGGKK